MLCKEIIEKIEETYPRNRAMKWDNVGLLAGRLEKNVEKIYIALDLTDEVLRQAVESDADMIITHHPLIFSPLHAVTDQDFIGRRIVDLLQHDISYYAMHTNYDVLRMAELSADILGMADPQVLEPLDTDAEEGIGKIGLLERRMTLKECSQIVKERFGIATVKVFGDLEQEVRCAAICPGSGKSVIDTALKRGAEVLITGDIDHHAGIDAVARGMAVMDAGHYGLEHIYIEDMYKFLSRRLSGITLQKAALLEPFQVL